MAKPVARDLDEVRARLADWSSGRLARNAPVEITDLTSPQSTGYSGETFLFRAPWNTKIGTSRSACAASAGSTVRSLPANGMSAASRHASHLVRTLLSIYTESRRD